MADRTALGDVLEFLRLFWELEHVLHRRSKRLERAQGITGVQRLVIRIVAQRPELSPGELAHLLHLDPSTLTGVLRRLEEKKVLTRLPDPGDRRRTRLQLTGRGRQLNRRRRGTDEDLVARVLRRAPAAQVEAARGILRALLEEDEP